ncbi:MAG: hypothetical protein AVDCRST_MAG49-3669 [uncultured Thermomicrobiales bacterium]|uniref:Uncharacterized protein n=1 Tax=uncultured Thermomicrobiales bacterium TaxID=1645740 RepID=A0A6J4VE86_9BACT|nr:MAG: hypothetical protein AVDCRST_MAG49-3669 [uncultured Thermomicrobiales bacterium]
MAPRDFSVVILGLASVRRERVPESWLGRVASRADSDARHSLRS